MYIDLNTGRFEYDDGYCEDGYCGDVTASSSIKAAQMFFDENPIATDGEWELYEPATFEAAKGLASVGGGKKAMWATSYDPYYFDRYTEKGPLFIFINKNTGEKYQSHPATKSWLYDVNDRNLGKQALIDFLDSHPKFAAAFSSDGYDYFYVNQQEVADENFTPRFASDFDGDDVEACGDIYSTTEIDASKMPARYQSVRDILGEDEWYYIEDYLMNGDGEYSLDDILYDMDAWDHYADWKMQTYHKKPAISASTRIRARRYLR